MTSRNLFFRTLLLLAGLVAANLSPRSASAGPASPPQAPRGPYSDLRIDLGAADKPFSFIVYGDMRFTERRNTWDTDPVRRVALVQRIAQESPKFLFITGDLVLRGDSFGDWEVFDQETRPLRQAGIQIFPVLGNHDLAGSVQLAQQN